jgi:hypothetical protein
MRPWYDRVFSVAPYLLIGECCATGAMVRTGAIICAVVTILATSCCAVIFYDHKRKSKYW